MSLSVSLTPVLGATFSGAAVLLLCPSSVEVSYSICTAVYTSHSVHDDKGISEFTDLSTNGVLHQEHSFVLLNSRSSHFASVFTFFFLCYFLAPLWLLALLSFGFLFQFLSSFSFPFFPLQFCL